MSCPSFLTSICLNTLLVSSLDKQDVALSSYFFLKAIGVVVVVVVDIPPGIPLASASIFMPEVAAMRAAIANFICFCCCFYLFLYCHEKFGLRMN